MHFYPSDAPCEVGLLKIAALAGKWVMLAGKTLSSREFSEAEQAAAAVQRINKIKNGG